MSDLTFRSLIHFEFSVLGSILILFFYMYCPIFLAPLIEEIVFFTLYILASFVIDSVQFSHSVVSDSL